LTHRGYMKRVKKEGLQQFLKELKAEGIGMEQAYFLCIGTDRSTGDALGPLVGTMLKERGVQRVCGTLEEPCDSSNLTDKLSRIPEGSIVIAIDACLGQPDSVGLYLVSNRPLEPGKSVGKKLPPAGSYSIAAVVNASGGKTYTMLQTTSLNLVMRMAREIAEAIADVFLPLDQR
jgi:putative sporulation protein YyaC